jgi:hypothetical protein
MTISKRDNSVLTFESNEYRGLASIEKQLTVRGDSESAARRLIELAI